MITDEIHTFRAGESGVEYLVDAVGLDGGVDEFRYELTFQVLFHILQ